MTEFKGFNQDQQFKLLNGMGYNGPNEEGEMEKFLQASPAASVKMGKYAKKAAERLSLLRGFAEGGAVSSSGDYWKDQHQAAASTGTKTPDPTSYPVAPKTTTPKPAASSTPEANQWTEGGVIPQDQFDAERYLKDNPDVAKDANYGSNPYLHYLQFGRKEGRNVFVKTGPEAQQKAIEEQAGALKSTAVENPKELVTPANIASVVQKDSQFVDHTRGKDTTEDKAKATTVDKAATAETPDKFAAGTYNANKSQEQIKAETDALKAATAEPSAKATVRGQLESLMKDFEGGETPPWASGAMRNAMSLMQQRGMGASSMAGQAVVQAAMESAIAIAGQDAQINAQFEMKNLDNEQQTALFKSQQNIASIFTDQAADNAAKQFNASSKNQVNQFFADMESTISRFNADQINAVMQFNAGQKNAIEQFNTSLKAQRDQFNATNDLVIAQANAKWRQTVNLANTQAQNEANLQSAQNANGLTARALDHIWQQERDIMAFAFQSAENAEDRAHELLVANKGIDAQKSAQKKSALGFIAGKLLFG